MCIYFVMYYWVRFSLCLSLPGGSIMLCSYFWQFLPELWAEFFHHKGSLAISAFHPRILRSLHRWVRCFHTVQLSLLRGKTAPLPQVQRSLATLWMWRSYRGKGSTDASCVLFSCNWGGGGNSDTGCRGVCLIRKDLLPLADVWTRNAVAFLLCKTTPWNLVIQWVLEADLHELLFVIFVFV